MFCFEQLNTTSSNLKLLHRGKVRDSFKVNSNGSKIRMIAVTDRISAFNRKIETPIPDKGAILNNLSLFWFKQTEKIIPNHVIKLIDPNLMLVWEATPIRIEMVVRQYLTGSIWNRYKSGIREFNGLVLPDGLTKNSKFDSPILTPTTKDDEDREISLQEIIDLKLISSELLQQMCQVSLKLFEFGSQLLLEKGIILVDTKYEFGLLDDKLILIDEIHTPDSSRFWNLTDLEKNNEPEPIDKEFVRNWITQHSHECKHSIHLPDDVVKETTQRYHKIWNEVVETDLKFSTNLTERIKLNLLSEGLISSEDSVELKS